MSLAVLTPARNTGHREKLAAKLPGNIAGREHHPLDQVLENLHQLRPLEDLEILPVLVLVICYAGPPYTPVWVWLKSAVSDHSRLLCLISSCVLPYRFATQH